MAFGAFHIFYFAARAQFAALYGMRVREPFRGKKQPFVGFRFSFDGTHVFIILDNFTKGKLFSQIGGR